MFFSHENFFFFSLSHACHHTDNRAVYLAIKTETKVLVSLEK